VLVVGGPGGIPDIQPAVDDACDGDSILVKQGVYSGFVVAGKSLSIVADAGATPVIHGAVTVQEIDVRQRVFLAGFLIATWGIGPPLTARFDQGGVRVEECVLGRDIPNYASYEQPALLLDHADDVALATCSLEAGLAFDGHHGYDGTPGPPAVRALWSSLALFDCVLEGGNGGSGGDQKDEPNGNGGAGGEGLYVARGFAYASGSGIRAGDGGEGGSSWNCVLGGPPGDGGAGGTGVRVSIGPNLPGVVLLGSLVVGGAGGAGGIDHSQDGGGRGCFGHGDPGPDGPPFSAPVGGVQFLAGAPRRLIVPRIAREGEIVTAHCYGLAGDVVQVFASDATQFAYVASLEGVQLIPPSRSVLVASGTIPTSGSLDLEVPLPQVEEEARTVFLQAYFGDSSNQRFVATPSTILELDPRY
jgi:hypothetical protein